jgi:hypothetical protein
MGALIFNSSETLAELTGEVCQALPGHDTWMKSEGKRVADFVRGGRMEHNTPLN